MTLADDIAVLLVRELDGFRREVALLSTDDELWRVAPGVTNPVGSLALHVAGNLRHFIGAVLGRDSYKRDRQAEFGTRGMSRMQVDEELVAAIGVVRRVLGSLTREQLADHATALPNGVSVRTDLFLLHLVAHTAFHLGQAGYLRRTLTGNAVSANPLSLDPLAAAGAV
jgi:uncharacterized damage-inducible protein DinB